MSPPDIFVTATVFDGKSYRPVPQAQRAREAPAIVARIIVDPANRLWYQLKPVTRPPTLEQARQLISREFAAVQPQMTWIAPILFEPTGRIWFLFEGDAEAGQNESRISWDMTARLLLSTASPPTRILGMGQS